MLMVYVIRCGILCWCIFFFKQKTAYELRISDWSSDVCSSDLSRPRLSPHLWIAVGRRRLQSIGVVIGADEMVRGRLGRRIGRVWRKIGRASCRERVCQYV